MYAMAGVDVGGVDVGGGVTGVMGADSDNDGDRSGGADETFKREDWLSMFACLLGLRR